MQQEAGLIFTAVDTLHGINMKMKCHLSDVIELPLCPSNPQEKSSRENKEQCLSIKLQREILVVWMILSNLDHSQNWAIKVEKNKTSQLFSLIKKEQVENYQPLER